MLVTSGKSAALKGRPWAGIELVSEARIEEVVLHLTRWAHRNLTGRPFQLLFPVKSRDLDGIRLLSPYLWARTDDLQLLRGMKSVMGVQGLVSDADSQTIEVEDAFIQTLITEALVARDGWSRGVTVGSFCRVLVGEERMLCGVVDGITGGIAELRIKLRLRDVILHIPVKALLNLSHVPADQRHYFYVGDER